MPQPAPPTAGPATPSPARSTTLLAQDDLGVVGRRRRTTAWLLGLGAGLLATLVLAVGIGAVTVPAGTTLRVVGHHALGLGERTWSLSRDAIIWDVRLPRVVLGAAVGAGLAVCGVALQAMVRNVLADPYLLGVSSGASSGAAAAILFGVGAGLGQHALPVSAFAGALAASLLVLVVARSGGRVTSIRLLLAGVAVGYALYALTSFLIFAADSAEGSRSVLFWLLGSLGLASWTAPLAVVCVVVLGTVLVLTHAGRRLDVLAIGDETAQTLGLTPDRLRVRLLVLVSLCIGVVVSAAGSIGFVGLVVPHLARRAVGSSHRAVVPVAALMGAILLVWADVVARTLLQPQEIPIGILTSLVGAPFLLVLIRRMHVSST
ncbi:iron chelate uptake ABC transporter family permease subunit [Janibacter melonis]|uniref:Iron chelate uptake ABC transporter family permease subunit n=2 Tax=Janibacter melonis TaxID=262209 RepID=A0A5P8FJ22_9MICO|nr:iron ABC transporter permease [Janibacter melonis]QFQ29213.2 iron chelate uptake ABC transporter family permease subunit [Janibacter melonis]